MDKTEVREFFDRQAPFWDERMIRDDFVIDKILENALVTEGKDILDIACGTGVLIPDYLKRNVNSVTAVDISPEMVKIAQNKFSQEKVEILCADVDEITFDRQFDCVMVYNAFPHFSKQQDLVRKLSKLLKKGGTLTIAHGMSREKINQCHQGGAAKVSLGLLDIDELAAYLESDLEVIVSVSDERMYQIVGLNC